VSLTPEAANRLFGALRAQGQTIAQHKELIDQLTSLVKTSERAPEYIDEMPGRRVPYFAPIELSIAADSTAGVDGTHVVSTDGPFVVTGIAAFFRKTSGSYQGVYGQATSVGARIASQQAGHGGSFIFDHPAVIDGDFEIVDRGSDRQWQHRAVSSAVLHPEMGGVYVFPIQADAPI